MAWLRPILLIAGVLFIAALIWYERRRPRQAAGAEPARAQRSEPSMPAAGAATGSEREGQRPLPVIHWSAEVLAAGPPPMQRAAAAVEPGSSPDAGAPPAAPRPPDPPPLVVDWPGESQRQIVTLRVVPATQERMAGHALRQGLAACGFRHGPFGIFHLGAEDGRVILSAASLVRPGLLDPATMDLQRYAGVNLFAVLPGPLPAEQALELLGRIALELAGRVAGRVQDDGSVPFNAAQAAEWRRRSLAAIGAAAAGGSG